MRWHYDLTGADPIIRDMPVYDASALKQGELLMKGTSANNSADCGISLISAYNATPSNVAVDAVGLLNENTYESGGTTPDRVIDNTSGVYLGKTIVNPYAVYLAEYSQNTSHDTVTDGTSDATTIVDSNSSSNTLDGYFVYLTGNGTGTSGLEGSLRQVTASDASGLTVASLNATPLSGDTYIIISPPNVYVTDVDDTATMLACEVNIGNIEGATNLRVLCSYLQSDSYSMAPLVGYKTNGRTVGNMDNLSNPRFFADIVMKDHLYGQQE